MNSCELNVTLPVYNEDVCLRQNALRVVRMLEGLNSSFEVVIVDNGSSDSTARIAESLAASDSRIRFEHLPKAGRGAALKTGWLSSQARIVSYMDIDLSTDLSCYPLLIEPIQRQEAEFVTGSRLMPGADVTRCWQREWISRSYVSLLRVALGGRLSDYQCGFKAADRNTVLPLIPMIQDESWFFDTELLFLAQRMGWRVNEVPVQWREDRDSSVRLLPTVIEDLLGVCRLRWDSMKNRL